MKSFRYFLASDSALTIILTRQQRRVDTVKLKSGITKNGSERITMNCKITEQQTRQIMRLDGDVTAGGHFLQYISSIYEKMALKCLFTY